MMSPRRNLARGVRILGIALAGAIAVMGVYLPMTGDLDWALLPFLLAFVPYALADVAAWLIQEGAEARKVLSRSRRNPIR